MKCIVTGGAGFIGANLVNHLLANKKNEVATVDKLTYAGNLANLREVINKPNHHFIKADITDQQTIINCIQDFCPDVIFHLAAESHVDRSIDNAYNFVHTNVLGTEVLLSSALCYWRKLKANSFKFIHISTDEVYGTLGDTGKFDELCAFNPNSPYSASKAASDLLCKAYYRTYEFPVIVANCSNNYGPLQFPEKLIPLCISNALNEQPLPIYGDGKQVRDWLYVTDHIKALEILATRGVVGESYCIGGEAEHTNIEVVNSICTNLDNLAPRKNKKSYQELITYVNDRPGHDRRYAIDASKIMNSLYWQPVVAFQQGLTQTVAWYIHNQKWLNSVTNNKQFMNRRGLTTTRN